MTKSKESQPSLSERQIAPGAATPELSEITIDLHTPTKTRVHRLLARLGRGIEQTETQARGGDLSAIEEMLKFLENSVTPLQKLEWLKLGMEHTPVQEEKRAYFKEIEQILLQAGCIEELVTEILPQGIDNDLTDGVQTMRKLKENQKIHQIKAIIQHLIKERDPYGYYLETLIHIDTAKNAKTQKKDPSPALKKAGKSAEDARKLYVQNPDIFKLPLMPTFYSLWFGKKEASAQALCQTVLKENRSQKENGQAHLLLAYIYAKLGQQKLSSNHANMGAQLVQTDEIRKARPKSVPEAIPFIIKVEALQAA